MGNGSEPATPMQDAEGFAYRGLTKREAMAMAAMQGLLANNEVEFDGPAFMATEAVENADALLRELKK